MTASVYNINIDNNISFGSGVTAGHVLTVASDGTGVWQNPSVIGGGGVDNKQIKDIDKRIKDLQERIKEIDKCISFPFVYQFDATFNNPSYNFDLSSIGDNLIYTDISNVNANSLTIPGANLAYINLYQIVLSNTIDIDLNNYPNLIELYLSRVNGISVKNIGNAKLTDISLYNISGLTSSVIIDGITGSSTLRYITINNSGDLNQWIDMGLGLTAATNSISSIGPISDIPSLDEVSIQYNYSIRSFGDISNINGCNGIYFYQNSGLQSIGNIDNILLSRYITAARSGDYWNENNLTINSNTGLTSIGTITNVGPTYSQWNISIEILSNQDLSLIGTISNCSVGQVYIRNNNSLTNIQSIINSSIQNIQIFDNYNLTTIGSLAGLTSCLQYNFTNCSLDAQSVSQILIDIDNSGLSYGSLYGLSTGSSAGLGSLTINGVNSYNSLINKNWYIEINP